MSSLGKNLKYNERECDYDYYGDTRQSQKYNEEKYYSKHSYSLKENLRISIIKLKKEKERKQELLNQIYEHENEWPEKKKREIKQIDAKVENYGNNYQEIIKKPKKKKIPKKDKIRF